MPTMIEFPDDGLVLVEENALPTHWVAETFQVTDAGVYSIKFHPSVGKGAPKYVCPPIHVVCRYYHPFSGKFDALVRFVTPDKSECNIFLENIGLRSLNRPVLKVLLERGFMPPVDPSGRKAFWGYLIRGKPETNSINEGVKTFMGKRCDKLSEADLVRELALVLLENTSLTANGWSSDMKTADVLDRRRWLEDGSAAREFANAREFILQNVSPNIKISKQQTSYGMKHTAERWHRTVFDSGCEGYISNGAFIAAMLSLGYKQKRNYLSTSCLFYMNHLPEWLFKL